MIEQTNTNEQTGLNEQAHTNEQTEVDFAFENSPSACSAEETIAENSVLWLFACGRSTITARTSRAARVRERS